MQREPEDLNIYREALSGSPRETSRSELATLAGLFPVDASYSGPDSQIQPAIYSLSPLAKSQKHGDVWG